MTVLDAKPAAAAEQAGELDEAIRAALPLFRLRGQAEALVRGGMAPDDLLAHLQTWRVDVREQGKSDLEDVILELMDLVVGWCSPGMEIPTA